MKKVQYEFYNPSLSLQENAEILRCSISAIKKYFKAKEIDRRYDASYSRWKQVQDFFRRKPHESLKVASIELGYSINTIRKYKKLSEDDLIMSFRDTTKVSCFDIRNVNSIKTISYNQDEILAWIMKLYNNCNTFECDLTASKCIFWKNLPAPLHLYDKYPQLENVRDLEEADKLSQEQYSSIIYDLPFIVSDKSTNNIIKDRFTYFSSVKEAYDVNIEMLNRACRLLKRKGLLIVKTMDCYKANSQIWISDFVVQEAFKRGLIMKDKFILLSKLKLFTPTHKQNVARKYHSYFFVFQKP